MTTCSNVVLLLGGEIDVVGLGSRDVFTAYNSHGIVSSPHGPSDAFTFKFKSLRMRPT